MTHITIPPSQIPAGWLIMPASYLMDRVEPAAARIALPQAEVAGGTVTFQRGPLPEPPRPGGRLARLRRNTGKPQALPHENVFDLRRNDPQNWAHFLNNHLPLVFAICSRMDLSPAEALLVLPENTPDYICAAAEMFDIAVLRTNAALTGEGIVYDVTPWTAQRGARADWVQTDFAREKIARIDAAPATAPLPSRVFLSRRSTRALENEAETAAWLSARGFVTVYPEELSAADQIRLFRRAEIMVAIHGAGLAPLLYCAGDAGPSHLIEILHAGHMTNVYRVMAAQVGCNWIGVQGKLKPDYIASAYDFDTSFQKWSLDNFEADITALEIAFDMAGLTERDFND